MAMTIDSAEGRASIYKDLQRHNRRIDLLRWGVPVLGLLVTGGLVAQIVIANIGTDYGLSGIKLQDGHVVIADPRYGGVMPGGTSYDVVADAARVQMDNPDLIDLETATITTLDKDGYRMVAKSANAHLDLGVQQVTVPGQMDTTDSEGVTGTLHQSLIDWPSQSLHSDGPANFLFDDGSSIAGAGLDYDSDKGVWVFASADYHNPGDDKQAPVRITSDVLTYKSKEDTADFAGHAVVTEADSVVKSQSVLVHFAAGGTSEVDLIEALGGVEVTNPDQTATGDKGTYHPDARTLTLSGNVKVVTGTGTVTAPTLDVDMDANVSSFTGGGGTRVHGDFSPPGADRAVIDADRMVDRPDDRTTEFSGNTNIHMSEQTIQASRFIVHYAGSQGTDIASYEMLGNVRIRNPDQTATGDRGVYDPGSRILRLTGNVEVTNDSGTVNAPELRVNMRTNVSEFTATSGGGRVNGVFTPDNPPEIQ